MARISWVELVEGVKELPRGELHNLLRTVVNAGYCRGDFAPGEAAKLVREVEMRLGKCPQTDSPVGGLHCWVTGLPRKMQAVLFCALRGLDGAPKGDPTKTLVRYLRRLVLVPANPDWETDPKDNFMRATLITARDAMDQFLGDFDAYPVHFVLHLLHAYEIVAYQHPEADVRALAEQFYMAGCEACHMHPETPANLEFRLG